MDLGAFSVSLSVADIEASRDFYQKLGFEPVGGNIDDNWLILRNGDHVIGLFQGMFDKNMLTFNPGWNQQCKDTDPFTDVCEIQRKLKEQGVELYGEADETSKGPASVTLCDPDGNPILIDQHR
jgi:catechol 2,3-dioxygenase-like lactoylglutathione lyase family enzyme